MKEKDDFILFIIIYEKDGEPINSTNLLGRLVFLKMKILA